MDLTRKRLQKEQTENYAEAEGLIKTAETEGRDLTAEDNTRLGELRTRRDEIAASLKELDALRDAGVPVSAAVRSQAAPVITVHDNAEDKPWSHFGEFLQAVAMAGTPNAGVDPRLLKAAASGASQGVPADGGFLVGSQFSDALLDRAREESPILNLVRRIPVGDGSDSIDLPVIDETSRANGSRWGGVQVYRKAEADTVTATKPKFGELKIEPTEIMGLAYATERILRNAPAMAAIFDDAFASEFAFKLTDEIINGPGGASCLGILNAPGTVSQAKETGQAAATINVSNLSNMWAHVPARSKSRGIWIGNGDIEPQLDILSIPAGTGALEPRFVTYDAQGTLRIKGRPFVPVEQCPTLGTVGDIIFFDPAEYILATKGDIDGQESMHVRFIYGEMTFRWTYYANGRPAWLSSVSAFKGSTSLSPYVTLATRA